MILDKLRSNRLAKWGLVLVWLGIAGWLTVRLTESAILPYYDFIAFWSGGHLQLAGQNPYSPEQLHALQRAVGATYDIPLMVWNPPWTLPLLLPFGLLEYSISRILWLWLSLGLVILCVDRAWRLYGGSTRQRWLARIVSFTFFPTLVALYLGQMGPFILAGVVGFLYFAKRERWWLAGAATLLIAVKPHLLYLFWIVLLLWALDRRRWSVLLGAGTAMGGATAVTMLMTPTILEQYVRGVLVHSPSYWLTPSLGSLVRAIFGWEQVWLAFVPAVVAALWFLWYWQRHQRAWAWLEEMPLLLFVSLITTPYRWSHDQVVLLPAILQATIWLSHSRRRSVIILSTLIYVAISAFALLPILPPGDHWRFWMTPALFLLYLGLRRYIEELSQNDPSLYEGSSALASS